MCRHAAYVGPPLGLGAFLDRPAHGLVEQSYHPREMLTAKLNADGFGFGWYRESGAAGVYTNPMPIWSDINLAHIGAAFESRLWLGNVRSATPGQPVKQPMLLPLRIKLFGSDSAAPLADERLVLDDLRKATEVVARALAEFLMPTG